MTPSLDDATLTERLGALGRTPLRAPDAEEWQALQQALDEQRRPTRSQRWHSLAAALALAVIGLCVLFAVRSRPIDYRVQGGVINARGFVAATAATATLTFSEGTVLSLRPGAVGRVVELTEAGAHVTLEGGELVAAVTRQRASKWSFDAGPYLVRVTGTRFSVRWDTGRAQLDVRVEEGSVIVTGPLIDQGVVLKQNQQLVARTDRGDVKLIRIQDGAPVVEERLDEAGKAHAPSAAPPDRSAAPAATSAAPATPSIAAEPRPPERASFSARMAKGEFRDVLLDAERAGIDNVLSTYGSGELAALADAARYAQQPALARRALLAQRERFPRSAAASLSAFTLGRLAEDGKQPGAAIEWYERYLREAPRGRYASNALGRQMLLMEALDLARAQRLARDYLKRFPSGMYAPQAERLDRGR